MITVVCGNPRACWALEPAEDQVVPVSAEMREDVARTGKALSTVRSAAERAKKAIQAGRRLQTTGTRRSASKSVNRAVYLMRAGLYGKLQEG